MSPWEYAQRIELEDKITELQKEIERKNIEVYLLEGTRTVMSLDQRILERKLDKFSKFLGFFPYLRVSRAMWETAAVPPRGSVGIDPATGDICTVAWM